MFERYQRSEKALVGALAEMYVQGVSTRKVKAVTALLDFEVDPFPDETLEQLDILLQISRMRDVMHPQSQV